MTQAISTEQPTQNNSAMIRTLTLIATVSGLLVVLAVDMTQPLIAENQRIAVEQAVFQVIPNAKQWREYRLNEDTFISAKQVDNGPSISGISVYIGFTEQGNMTGIAAQAAAQGYADTIRLLYGYNQNCECITGIKIIKSAETPGLGDKIFRDRDFIANFKSLNAKLNSKQSALENAIITVKHGKKTEPWQIDAISGATVSSRAVGKALNESAQYLLPKLVTHLSHIEKLDAKNNEF